MRKKAIETATTWNSKDIEAGETLEGVYTKKEEVEGNFGTRSKYIIETTAGEKFGVFATKSLERQFAGIPLNSYVWITYKGVETTKRGFSIKVYEVEYDDEYQK